MRVCLLSDEAPKYKHWKTWIWRQDGALNCVQQAWLNTERISRLFGGLPGVRMLVKSKPNKDMFLENGGASCLKNVMVCHEADKNLLKELNNLLILLGESKQTYF